MSLKLTREGAYGYISILIAKSPNLDVLSNIIESGEVIDIQVAISKGILRPEYSMLLRAKTVDEVEDTLYSFYRQLLTELIGLIPKPYDNYANCFTEIFDLDKVISLIFSVEKQKLRPKYIVQHIIPLTNYILYSKKVESNVSSYISCLSAIGKELMPLNTIECIMKMYVKRVVNSLDSISGIESISNSLKIFYEFALLRFYRYVLNSKLLKLMYDTKLEDFAKEVSAPASILSRVIENIKKLDDYMKKDVTLYTVYELRSVYEDLKQLLYTPYSLIDRLTYLLVHKFYEALFVRYLATYRFAWR